MKFHLHSLIVPHRLKIDADNNNANNDARK